MILDASAVVAILLKEPGYADLMELIGNAPDVAIGAPTLVESSIVVTGRIGPRARDLAATMVHEGRIDVIAFSEDHSIVATDAFLRYGKGRHRANLTFGNCMAYAVACLANRPLLFLGDDFRHTDVAAAR